MEGRDWWIPPVSPHTPLWKNTHLWHFYTCTDPVIWTKLGIKNPCDVIHNGALSLSDGLKSMHHLQNSHLFCFLQFRHVFYAQLGGGWLTLQSIDLESLLRDDSLSKALGTIYTQLFTETAKHLMPCHSAWAADIPRVDKDDWGDMWEALFTKLVSARDHLILHRIYLTPARLARDQPSNCWSCSIPNYSFNHIFRVFSHPTVLAGDHNVYPIISNHC